MNVEIYREWVRKKKRWTDYVKDDKKELNADITVDKDKSMKGEDIPGIHCTQIMEKDKML